MQTKDIKARTIRKSQKVVGRGGKRGKTSGKGGKGQTARAGHRVRPEIRDVIKKLPKLRGYAAPSIDRKVQVVNLSALNKFENGSLVNPKSLGLRGKIKILSNGEITKKVTVEGCLVSKGARVKIEKAGGSVS
jgi:large subunit ribosomal protein L15